jgi:capsid protein
MAARRVMARQAFDTLTRGYDGAARGRRTEGWRAPGSSADTEIGVAGALLRDRMRDLVRNNPHAAKAVAVLVNNIIGAGIMPRPRVGTTRWTGRSMPCSNAGQRTATLMVNSISTDCRL